MGKTSIWPNVAEQGVCYVLLIYDYINWVSSSYNLEQEGTSCMQNNKREFCGWF